MKYQKKCVSLHCKTINAMITKETFGKLFNAHKGNNFCIFLRDEHLNYKYYGKRYHKNGAFTEFNKIIDIMDDGILIKEKTVSAIGFNEEVDNEVFIPYDTISKITYFNKGIDSPDFLIYDKID